jgi:serine/threonine protein kinase
MALPEPQVCLRTRFTDAADGLATRAHIYVTLKVCERNSVQARRELDVYKHLSTITSRHSGSRLVRTLLDAFEITGSEGSYQCLVHKPLGMSLSDLQARCPSQRLPEHLLKLTLIHVLLMLDFLHTEAQVIHTGNGIRYCPFDDLFAVPVPIFYTDIGYPDLQPRNILLDIEDESILLELEEREKSTPSPRKIDGDRVIHTSQQLNIPKNNGRPILCDFGEARFGKHEYSDDIQPYIYRAPEVVLHMQWSNKVDIWNIGVMVGGILVPTPNLKLFFVHSRY